jgi:tripartite-type tricarboxylate transporter receptor subunit TctC
MNAVRSAALVTVLAWCVPIVALLAQDLPKDFPSRPVRLVTLTAPGGSLDILARTIAQHLSEKIGQPVYVEARTGAGGNIGADAVAKAPADGYTIGMVTSSTHGINPTLYADKMPFDAVKDFAPITVAAELKNVIVVHPSVPAKTIPELVAHLKANPDKLSFGSAGTGTTQHMSGELFKLTTGTMMTHVAYRGAAAAIPDLVSGRIQLMFVSIPDVISHIQQGSVRAIGVTSKARATSLPDVVPVAEQGYPDFNVTAWFGLVAPAATPPAIVRRYNEIIRAALTAPDVKERLAGIGMDTVTSTPDEFAAHIRAEVARWGDVVKKAGVTLN